MVQYEKRGFTRTEMISLVLLSQSSGKTIKEMAKRRIKDKILLKDLAKEAQVDFEQLYSKARSIKSDIELRGESNLPPPIFETPSPSPTPVQKKKKKNLKDKEAESQATPSTAPKKEDPSWHDF